MTPNTDEQGKKSIRPEQIKPPLGKTSLAFLVHQSLAAWGPLLAAPFVLLSLAQLVWHLGWKIDFSHAQSALYGTPCFPVHVGLALLVGWALGGTFRYRFMSLLWILPFLSLFCAIIGVPLGIAAPMEFAVYPPVNHLTIADCARLSLSARLATLFGRGAGIQPYLQVAITLPFYSSMAYSLGVVMARTKARLPGFFEAMRCLRAKRLILLVGLPWFCLKLALDWQEAARRYPAIRTGRGLLYVSEAYAVQGVLMTFVLAVAVSLVGRRLFFTRFFLDDPAGSG